MRRDSSANSVGTVLARLLLSVRKPKPELLQPLRKGGGVAHLGQEVFDGHASGLDSTGGKISERAMVWSGAASGEMDSFSL